MMDERLFHHWFRDHDRQISDNFWTSEFECHCGDCGPQLISRNLIDQLELLREELGAPIEITSGYRCWYHNKDIGGAPKSRHLFGYAADLQPKDIPLRDVSNAAKDLFVGVGLAKVFVHVDIRDSEPAFWTY